MRRIRRLLLALAFSTAATAGHAAIAIDEATYSGANGDYNNLLNPPRPVAVVFDLGTGTNTFAGRIGTPADGGDTFLVQLDPFEVLTRIRLVFFTNATDFYPLGISQGTDLTFDRADSITPQPLVTLIVPNFSANRVFGPRTYDSGALSLGEAIYNTTVRSGVLAMIDNGPVGYRVEFDVTSTAPVPEPSTYALLLAGLGLLGWVARRRRG